VSRRRVGAGSAPMRAGHDGAMTEHHYAVRVRWTGDRGHGTTGYRDYDRDVVTSADGKPDLLGSADRSFHGDASRWNPEDLLLAALSECHLLSYLHVAAAAGVVVTAYDDDPAGTMAQEGIGGHFTSVVLRPRVVVAEEAMVEKAVALHHDASQACFIAASVNFPVSHEPVVTAG
jgi:organic hydroperoxide reductase OsmC/OhrA